MLLALSVGHWCWFICGSLVYISQALQSSHICVSVNLHWCTCLGLCIRVFAKKKRTEERARTHAQTRIYVSQPRARAVTKFKIFTYFQATAHPSRHYPLLQSALAVSRVHRVQFVPSVLSFLHSTYFARIAPNRINYCNYLTNDQVLLILQMRISSKSDILLKEFFFKQQEKKEQNWTWK